MPAEPDSCYLPIEDYGVIGNMRTVALVGINGSIDWYCYPHFDSPSVFGSLLDKRKGGRFSLSPEVGEKHEDVKSKQMYWPDTNVLVTRFFLEEGIAEILDFMPVGLPLEQDGFHQLFRRVHCVRGSVKLRLHCEPAFNYGLTAHETTLYPGGATFAGDGLTLKLSTNVPLALLPSGSDGEKTQREEGRETNGEKKGKGNGEAVGSVFELKEGECKVFSLRGSEVTSSCEALREEEDLEECADRLFQLTVGFWRKWLSKCTYRGRWREQIFRSALMLKLLTFEPTGAIIAAPTCSLPEVLGGTRNWDYRYSWIRDAAFTVYALLRIGFTEEAVGFIRWLAKYAAKNIDPNLPMPVLFDVHGEHRVIERELTHLEGYRGSSPVRVGNDASWQFQNDLYGELIDALYLANKYVSPISYDLWCKIRERANWICDHWQLPDDGVWEVRGSPKHYVYSKVMNWVALDRAIRLADKRSFPSDKDRWLKERDQIYDEVLQRGWNEELQAFTQEYEGTELDASLLIMPMVFFMSPTDPRMLKTIDAISRSPKDGGLVADGLVYRYRPGPDLDGLPGHEGTFNMCSFWLVEALTRAGQTDVKRLDQARLLFERALGFSNHLGLYAEQTGFRGEALGNFPQAFTHLALISAAFNLDRTLGKRA